MAADPGPVDGAPSDPNDNVPILMVDDQPSNLAALEVLLAQSGVHLVRAQSADEALLALLDREFAAIVLDIKMPGMSGIELAALIKQRRRTRHTPILFLTEHMLDQQEVLRGYGTGAVDYLVKPIQSEILRSKIAVFVDLFRKTRALARANEALQNEMAQRERAQEALRVANQDLEQRVLDRTEALQRADRRKDEFLASLAHELRNPLAPIRAAVEVLKLPALPERDHTRARGIIVRQVDQMTRLIDDLLDVSRITNDKLVLQLESVDLRQVIARAVETSRPFIAERNHRLSIRLPRGNVVLQADPARLAQVISNLLTNAAKYTSPGGNIEVTAEVVERTAIIRVCDTGVGIEANLLPLIFEMFMQGDHPRERDSSGLGIGLTLARRLVHMHGGTIEARSEGVGCGSEFVVKLPIVSREAQVSRREPDSERPPVALPPCRRVLVVDDNEDAAEMLATMLTAWGQDARVAYDGISALEIAQDFQPEVILLDLGLPRVDGFETARRVRAEPWGHDVLLVAVTGWGRDSDRRRSREAGFDEHLVKPVAPDALRELLSRPA